MPLTRRGVLAPLAALPALPLFGSPVLAQDGRLALTPACHGESRQTVSQTEGPFFRPDAPLRHDLAGDAPRGQPILIGGLVLDSACRPVVGAIVQVWHADDAGQYDNRGSRLRGHGFTDRSGTWSFRTIVPAAYWSRTRHYHFKVQRPGGPVLTTQLYFPDDPGNPRDPGFDPRLVLALAGEHGPAGRFDFVVA